MNSLLWREYRLNRWILVSCLVAILLSYLLGFVLHYFAISDPNEDIGGAAGFVWSVLTVASLAGNAIAGERADRSAEFVAYLPLRRSSTLASKLFLHLIAIVVLLAVNLRMLRQAIVEGDPDSESAFWVGIGLLVLGLLVYSVSWLASSLQSSPALATMIGLATPGLIVLCLLSIDERTEMPGFANMFAFRFAMIGFPVAVACFSFGTLYYLRRSEP